MDAMVPWFKGLLPGTSTTLRCGRLGPTISIFSTSRENRFAAVKDSATVAGSPMSLVACTSDVSSMQLNVWRGTANIIQNLRKGLLGKFRENCVKLPNFLLVCVIEIRCRDNCNRDRVFDSGSGAAKGDLGCKACTELTSNRKRELRKPFEQRTFTRALISNYN